MTTTAKCSSGSAPTDAGTAATTASAAHTHAASACGGAKMNVKMLPDGRPYVTAQWVVENDMLDTMRVLSNYWTFDPHRQIWIGPAVEPKA